MWRDIGSTSITGITLSRFALVNMDVADQLEDCSPTHRFLLMLLERVQGIEDGIHRIEKATTDPLYSLHGRELRNELHNIKDRIQQHNPHRNTPGSTLLTKAPSDAAVETLRSHGFKVWEAVLDRTAYYKDVYPEGAAAVGAGLIPGFLVTHFLTSTNAPDPTPLLYESFKELPYVYISL